MSAEDCRCGHGSGAHRPWGRGRCSEIVAERSWIDFDRCPCIRFDVSRLPAPGERLEFGKHRLNTPEAESAPAWPSLAEVHRASSARLRAEQKKARR